MDRRAFLRSSCLGCAGLTLGAGVLSLTGCASLPLVKVVSDGRTLSIPLSAFTESTQVIARASKLSYDVLVIKLPGGDFRSLYLRCTHEDQPLTATATGLHCPSHGSRFALDGSVKEGPATTPIRPFPVRREGELLIIQLTA
ncbi:MAG: Rieske (2Fe-2S) protein [Flavobacteriales bacterium]|nr:Rieske (2Fe-2S) protein [Flavobacteriales bacterium]